MTTAHEEGPFRVICEDGKVRHDGDFVHRPDAERWAEWGHICTRRHRIEALPKVEAR